VRFFPLPPTHLNKSFYFTLQSIVDLLIPGQTPGIKEQLVDLYGKPELLFFGPDGALRFFSGRED
jgi:hypothetical protein